MRISPLQPSRCAPALLVMSSLLCACSGNTAADYGRDLGSSKRDAATERDAEEPTEPVEDASEPVADPDDAGVEEVDDAQSEVDATSAPDAGSSSNAALDAAAELDASDATDTMDASDGADAASDAHAPFDAGDASDAAPSCSFGEARSSATTSNLNLFGTPVFFNDGGALPEGNYVIEYVDGCMKYGSGQGWTVNAYNGGCCSWWLIGESPSARKLVPPGTIGYAAGSGAFADFEACVTASKQRPPQPFSHDGGALGIWLQDSPYTDNLAGVDGRNPTWQLRRLGSCPDGGVRAE